MSYYVTVTSCDLSCDDPVIEDDDEYFSQDDETITFKDMTFKWSPTVTMVLWSFQKLGVRGHVVFSDNDESFDKYELHDDGVSMYSAVLHYNHVGELRPDGKVEVIQDGKTT